MTSGPGLYDRSSAGSSIGAFGAGVLGEPAGMVGQSSRPTRPPPGSGPRGALALDDAPNAADEPGTAGPRRAGNGAFGSTALDDEDAPGPPGALPPAFAPFPAALRKAPRRGRRGGVRAGPGGAASAG